MVNVMKSTEIQPLLRNWILSPPVLVSTSIIAVAAASSPIIVNLVKNLIKTTIKRLTKSFKNKKKDI